MARWRLRIAALALAALLGEHGVLADWLATITADWESADSLQKQLKEKFGEKIDGFHTVPVRSYYSTGEAVREEQEVRTLLDSEVPFVELRRWVESVHPYSRPMIISTQHGGPLIANKNNLERYLMGVVDINETTPQEAGLIAKELVQIKFAACSHVEPTEDKTDTQRISIKTTANVRKHIIREFGGLDFEWTPLQGNRPFLEWLETSVSAGSEL